MLVCNIKIKNEKKYSYKKAQLFKDEDVDALMNKMRIGFRSFIQSPFLIQKNKKTRI